MSRHASLAEAIADLYPRLPVLFGEVWQSVDVQLTTLLRELEGDNPDDAEDDLFELFGAYPEALAALNDELGKVALLRTRGGQDGAPRTRYVVVPVFYGTDRVSADVDGRNAYGGMRGDRLRLGRAEVSIPDDHRMGRVERPRWWRLEFREDPDRHVVIAGVRELAVDAFVDSARCARTSEHGAEALVFVHGYNVDFDDALRRAAQVAYDLHFDGLAMLFSWPSRGNLAGYLTDESSVRWAQGHFREFLTLVASRVGLAAVHVLAHSMGNRLVSEILGEEPPVVADRSWARLEQIVFAAPDIDRDTFRQLSARFHERAARCTLYASSKDVALDQSRHVHGYPRAGDCENGILVTPGIDSIDASAVDTSLMGHSYYGSNRSLLADLFNLFRDRRGPDERFGLLKRQLDTGCYWEFRP